MVFQQVCHVFFDKLQLQREGDRRIQVWAHQTGVALLQLQGPHRGIVGHVGVLPEASARTVLCQQRATPGYISFVQV